MSVPTVYLVGTERLPLIPEYLNLGTVVVVAPDEDTLQTWEDQRRRTRPATAVVAEAPGTVIDLAGRRIVSGGGSLPLSDLEFRVLSTLLDPPGRAVSFEELRRAGWGGPVMAFDVCSVRALIQRLRAKLQAAEAPLEIASVRSFGFRAETAAASSALNLRAL
jgi:DNA-binding response OmpR family regulator